MRERGEGKERKMREKERENETLRLKFGHILSWNSVIVMMC